MSRMDRTRDSLALTLEKLKREIEEIHAKGNYPTDYSLGFCNALIFMDHKLNFRFGEPKFYNRTTSVGKLPKPIALDPDDFQKMIEANRSKSILDIARLENIADKAMTVVRCLDKMETDETTDLRQEFSLALACLKEVFNEIRKEETEDNDRNEHGTNEEPRAER